MHARAGGPASIPKALPGPNLDFQGSSNPRMPVSTLSVDARIVQLENYAFFGCGRALVNNNPYICISLALSVLYCTHPTLGTLLKLASRNYTLTS